MPVLWKGFLDLEKFGQGVAARHSGADTPTFRGVADLRDRARQEILNCFDTSHDGGGHAEFVGRTDVQKTAHHESLGRFSHNQGRPGQVNHIALGIITVDNDVCCRHRRPPDGILKLLQQCYIPLRPSSNGFIILNQQRRSVSTEEHRDPGIAGSFHFSTGVFQPPSPRRTLKGSTVPELMVGVALPFCIETILGVGPKEVLTIYRTKGIIGSSRKIGRGAETILSPGWVGHLVSCM